MIIICSNDCAPNISAWHMGVFKFSIVNKCFFLMYHVEVFFPTLLYSLLSTICRRAHIMSYRNIDHH